MDRALNAQLKALRLASNTILAVHLIKTLFACLLLGRPGLELARIAQTGDLLRVVGSAFDAAPSQLATTLWTLCAYALLGPLLSQLVLARLAGRAHVHLAAGGRYGLALALGLSRLIALAALGAGAFALSTALAAWVPPAYESAARIAPLALAGLGAAWLITAHDLAVTTLAADEPARLRSAVTTGAQLSSLGSMILQCGFGGAALLAYALGETAARNLPGSIAALAATQLAALATTFIHAWWLKVALDLISRR